MSRGKVKIECSQGARVFLNIDNLMLFLNKSCEFYMCCQWARGDPMSHGWIQRLSACWPGISTWTRTQSRVGVLGWHPSRHPSRYNQAELLGSQPLTSWPFLGYPHQLPPTLVASSGWTLPLSVIVADGMVEPIAANRYTNRSRGCYWSHSNSKVIQPR